MATNSQLIRSSGGRLFRLHAVSGLITGLSANDVMFAFRNPDATLPLCLQSLKAKWRTVAGFTAAQEVAIAAHLVSSFAATNYASGTDLSNPASNPAYVRRDVGFGASLTEPRSKSRLVTGNVRISDTGALTHAGSPVIQSHPLLWDNYADLAAAATVQKGRAEIAFDPSDQDELEVGADGGFIIRAPIALGAGGTGRLSVEVCWFER
jgi:hypothetical protein